MTVRWRIAILVFAILCSVGSLRAVDPHARISQYAHSVWKVQDGVLNAPPTAITQTKDGYIWIGTETGLLRFDGVRFMPWTPPHWDELGDPEVYTLLATSDGALWIGTATRLAVWKDGRLKVFQHVPGRVNGLVEDHRGKVWFTVSRAKDHKPLCEVSGESFSCYGSSDGIGFPYGAGLAVSASGDLVVGSASQVIRWSPDRKLESSYTFDKLTSFQGLHGISQIEVEADDSVLVATGFSGPGLGLERLTNGTAAPFAVPGLDGTLITPMTLLTDHQHSLWLGTLADGIYRVAGDTVEHFSSMNGLSGDSIRDLREDQEGNIWVVTEAGLDCFRNLKIISWSSREGLNAGLVSSVLAARDGSIVVGGHAALSILRDGKFITIGKAEGLPGDAVTALLEDRAGRYWMGVGKELAIYSKERFTIVHRPDGQPTGVVISLAEDRDGSVFASVFGTSRELLQIKDDKVVNAFPSSLARSPSILAADPRGGIWLDDGAGSIGRFGEGGFQWVETSFKQMQARINDVVVSNSGSVFAGSSKGVVGWKDGKTKLLGTASGLPCESTKGLIVSNAGALLIRTSCGLIEIDRDDLEDWWNGQTVHIKYRVFDSADGARSSGTSFTPMISLAPDGRVWFANESGIQMFDPGHISTNHIPPPTHIDDVVADRVHYAEANGLSLPPLTRDIELRYAALSFVDPQKVRFRYKLENRDYDWQDPGNRRSAFYQDLKPGFYRFRVLASNNDGVWNDVGDVVDFRVRPAWFQTSWFRVFWIAGTFLLVWMMYRLRVSYIASAIAARFDERLAERTRMARELHDTFLQTVQGSKMVADDALDVDSDATRMRHALERLSVWLGQAVEEGRAALHALRVSTTERNHLAEYLNRAAEEQRKPASMSVSLTILGDARDVHPIVRDEIVRVGEEAIRNACFHSKGSQLEIELRYAEDLYLRVKDNGVGIDPSFLDTGRLEHYGLQGMRERADRIRGKITITGRLNEGTEMTLRVPGSVAYRYDQPALPTRLMQRVRRLFNMSGEYPD